MVNTDAKVLESRTRDRVLRVVSQEGPVSITVLVDRLGLTETAVRRQVDALNADGYAASARPVGIAGGQLPGIQLCQGHCPVQHVAAEFPQFCEAETEAFSRLLGVHVQRLATLAHGDHVCTTFVPTPTTERPSS